MYICIIVIGPCTSPWGSIVSHGNCYEVSTVYRDDISVREFVGDFRVTFHWAPKLSCYDLPSKLEPLAMPKFRVKRCENVPSGNLTVCY